MARYITEGSDLLTAEDATLLVTENHVDSSRGITVGMETQVTAAQLRPFFLVKLAFDTADVNLWTGLGELSFDGDTYQGAGDMLGISHAEETQEVEAQGMQFTLTGVATTLIALAMDEDYQERPAYLWIGCFDTDGTIVADPIPLFVGRMDVMTLEDDGETATIVLTAEHRLIDLNRAYERNFTLDEHQDIYDGDMFFEFVPFVQDAEIPWGKGVTE